MIQVNEVRIGNFLQWKNSEVKNNYFNVKSIQCDYDYFEDAEGVPLTEEWLLKFGFKKRTTIGHSIQYFIGENPITKDWLFDILWLTGYDYPFYRNGHFKIKYVHQLQNLYFALTEKELTLKIKQ